MINLLQAILDRVDEIFPNANIYIKDVEQGLIEPCFFVRTVNTDVTTLFAKRYRIDCLVNIVYLNQSANAFKLQEVEQKLLYGMKNISIKTGGIYGFNSAVKSNDGILSFTINYKFNTKEEIILGPNMAENKIKSYANEEAYKEAVDKENPGMWKPSPWEKEEKVIPKIHPLDERYVKKEDVLMGRKEHKIYDREK